MDNQMIISFLELALALVLGVMSLFITHYILVRIYRSKFPAPDENPYKNTAFMVFLSGVMLSVGYLLTGIIEPLSSTLDLLLAGPREASIIWEYTKFLALFAGLGFVLGAVINVLAFMLFSALTTQVKELDEIKNGNIGVAVLVSVIAITIAIFCKEPFLVLLESFIPYPEVPRLF